MSAVRTSRSPWPLRRSTSRLEASASDPERGVASDPGRKRRAAARPHARARARVLGAEGAHAERARGPAVLTHPRARARNEHGLEALDYNHRTFGSFHHHDDRRKYSGEPCPTFKRGSLVCLYAPRPRECTPRFSARLDRGRRTIGKIGEQASCWPRHPCARCRASRSRSSSARPRPRSS